VTEECEATTTNPLLLSCFVKNAPRFARRRFDKVAGNLGKNFLGQPKKIASELKEAEIFWPAEKYHQQYLSMGGRGGNPQSAEKGATDTIRCYG